MDEQMLDDQLEPIYDSSVLINDVTWKTFRERRTIETDGERGSGKSVLAAWHDDPRSNRNFSSPVTALTKNGLFFVSNKKRKKNILTFVRSFSKVYVQTIFLSKWYSKTKWYFFWELFLYLLRTFCTHLGSFFFFCFFFVLFLLSVRFGQISPLAFFRWFYRDLG